MKFEHTTCIFDGKTRLREVSARISWGGSQTFLGKIRANDRQTPPPYHPAMEGYKDNESSQKGKYGKALFYALLR